MDIARNAATPAPTPTGDGGGGMRALVGDDRGRVGGRDGRDGPADSGDACRRDGGPEWKDGEPPDESVEDLKGWTALMDGLRIASGPAAEGSS